MEAPPPEASDLPSLSQIITYGFYGVGVAVAVVLGRLGFMQGKGTPEAGTERAEIAGAVISDTKANEIVHVLHANTEALEANTNALERTREEIRDIERELADLRIELARGRGR